MQDIKIGDQFKEGHKVWTVESILPPQPGAIYEFTYYNLVHKDLSRTVGIKVLKGFNRL